jgi:dTDP-4-amino-4,6-dideoxygalactose transaminase
MTDIQASLGIHQLKKIEAFTKKREAIASYYDKHFKNLRGVIIPTVKKYVRHARHLYPILIDQSQLTINRDAFFKALSAENIGSSVHFIPVYRHPYYAKNFKARAKDFPVTEQVYARTISLPLNNAMTMQDAKDVVMAVKKIITYYQK